MSFSTGGRGSRQEFSDINITPLTDVFLVLLVIMFLVAPLLDEKSSLKVDLPSAANSSKKASDSNVKTISIEVSKEGIIAINGQTVVPQLEKDEKIHELVYTKLSELAPQGGDQSAEKPSLKIKADSETRQGRMLGVYDAIMKAKSNKQVGSMSLVTEEIVEK